VAEIRAIVLDFNGTLAQDDHLVAPLYVEMFASLGLPLTVEEYHREFAAIPDRDVAELALRRAGLPVDETRREALVTARLEGYLAAVADEPPIAEHALDFVRAAAATVELAITSGAFRREIEHVLSAAGIRDCFTAVVSIDDVAHGKPDPEGFSRALAEVNALTGVESPIEPGQAVAVEDATEGAHAARAAGMRVAAIRGLGYDPASGYADVVVERLDRAALAQMLALGSTEERS
jgi:beta-phosphoglucomutase